MDKIKNDKQHSVKTQTYLSFKIGKETFAANVMNVLNILEMRSITEVPKSPDYIKGVINLRGNVLPVTDLRIKFGLPEIKLTNDTCILVLHIQVEDEEVILGALVDSVEEVLEIEESEIKPSPAIGTKYIAEFIQGIWMLEDKFIMILNLGLIFSTDDLIMIKKDLQKIKLEENIEDRSEKQ